MPTDPWSGTTSLAPAPTGARVRAAIGGIRIARLDDLAHHDDATGEQDTADRVVERHRAGGGGRPRSSNCRSRPMTARVRLPSSRSSTGGSSVPAIASSPSNRCNSARQPPQRVRIVASASRCIRIRAPRSRSAVAPNTRSCAAWLRMTVRIGRSVRVRIAAAIASPWRRDVPLFQTSTPAGPTTNATLPVRPSLLASGSADCPPITKTSGAISVAVSGPSARAGRAAVPTTPGSNARVSRAAAERRPTAAKRGSGQASRRGESAVSADRRNRLRIALRDRRRPTLRMPDPCCRRTSPPDRRPGRAA